MGTANLIDLCKQGDKTALGELYHTYSKRMMKVICHYVTDWSIAQDILHDGFLIVFSRIGQLKDVSKIEYWMGTIMKNLSLQYLKETDFSLLSTDDFDIPDIPEFDESIPMEELETIINRLPIGYKKVFKLAVLEQKTHKEIGKLLGVSEQTSGSQLFHARIMLRKMITEYKIEMGLLLVGLVFISGFFMRNYHRADAPSESSPQAKTASPGFPPATTAKATRVFITPDTTSDGKTDKVCAENPDTAINMAALTVQATEDTLPRMQSTKANALPYPPFDKEDIAFAPSFNKGFAVSLKG
ncbi:MAG: sigma-70 family RNA polymerase sigma factor, partial [Odoribacter sp.]|nr:sigma-70 family RNA polymerase sigma factor [Odoribacter sp.]